MRASKHKLETCSLKTCTNILALAGAIALLPTMALSAPLAMADPTNPAATIFQDAVHDPQPSEGIGQPANLRRQIVAYPSRETPGTIVIDTPNTYLYVVLGNGRAIRYGIGVGREGFTWSGVQTVSRKAEWPDWIPPAEMIARQQYLPRFMAGGPGNPLGARAMYLGQTTYRIHGTNDPTTIGKQVSSGCIRLTNEDVIDLYSHVNVGTKVVVLPASGRRVQAPARHDERATAARALRPAPVSQVRSSSLAAFDLY